MAPRDPRIVLDLARPTWLSTRGPGPARSPSGAPPTACRVEADPAGGAGFADPPGGHVSGDLGPCQSEQGWAGTNPGAGVGLRALPRRSLPVSCAPAATLAPNTAVAAALAAQMGEAVAQKVLRYRRDEPGCKICREGSGVSVSWRPSVESRGPVLRGRYVWGFVKPLPGSLREKREENVTSSEIIQSITDGSGIG
ncbi:stAR-related lipid transfer protein 5 [Rhinolophus sinicus]|uniref:stAR-related lipid transfer protein 5 n=1 Tax=Rhinolophus sinicus TaxID=89399 RepID=UPI003D7920E2